MKALIALAMLSTLVLSFSMQGLANKSTSSVKNKSLAEETPNITNEAEYAEFVRKREDAGQASSAKQASKALSSESSRSKAVVK